MQDDGFNTTNRDYSDEQRENDHRLSVLASMESHVEKTLQFLKPVEKIWQPSDMLPGLSTPDWKEKLDETREMSRCLSDDILVVLVGDMITEEALPSYQSELGRFEGFQGTSGTSESPWARWSRGWTAEENRHGDILNRYLAYTGRVNMRSVEVTIQRLIRNGFDTGGDGNAYKGFVYTSFQERATKISHRNVGRVATAQGDPTLAKICNQIANDEARHEEGYKSFMDRIFEIDPLGAIVAFGDVMKKMVVMPARLMDDGETEDLYDKFMTVAQKLKVYTTIDYADIIDHLMNRWKISALSGLSGDAAKAQDFLGGLSDRYRKLAGRVEKRLANEVPVQFSWLKTQ